MKKDVWAAGDLYEPYVGRWSRVVAKEFLAWLNVPVGKDWLDVGCGTGALTQCILGNASPARVHGIDPSAGFVDYAKAHTDDPRAGFEVGDAQALPVAAPGFDAAVAGLVLNFVPQPERAAREMRRAVRSGGKVAAYVWDYAGKMELMRHFWDAAVELNADARALDEGIRFPLCHPRNSASAPSFRRGSSRDRRTDAVPGFRGLLDAVSGWSGACAGLLHVACRGKTRRSARAHSLQAADPR